MSGIMESLGEANQYSASAAEASQVMNSGAGVPRQIRPRGREADTASGRRGVAHLCTEARLGAGRDARRINVQGAGQARRSA